MRRIVETHESDVFYLALGLLGNRTDAEDAMQESFVKAMKSLHRFRGESGLSTWLYRITTNTCRDMQRRKKWSLFSFQDPNTHIVEPTDTRSPDRETAGSDFSTDLRRSLDHLTTKERQVFVLRQFQELSVRETADVLSIAEGSVKTLLFRAMQKLRERLQDHYPEGVRT